MILTTLAAALPQFLTDALTDITATSQVLVADAPQSVQPSDARVSLVKHLDSAPAQGGGLGSPLVAHRFLIRVEAGAATQAARATWVDELVAYVLHHKPAGVGLDHAELVRATVAPGPGVGIPGNKGAAIAELEVLFVGGA